MKTKKMSTQTVIKDVELENLVVEFQTICGYSKTDAIISASNVIEQDRLENQKQ